MNKILVDSCVPWIGLVPKDWEIIRFKNKFYNLKEIAGSNSVNYERLALTLNGVVKRSKLDDDGLQPKEFDTYQILNKNDFIFKMIDLQNISTSRVGLSPYTGLVSPAYIRFRPMIEHTKYMYYYFMSLYYNLVFNNIAGNGVRSALNAFDIGNIKCPFPTLAEQIKISTFLDDTIEKIENVIAIQETQIDKLKDYKMSLISSVVSGAHSKMKKKYSGNNLIGDIPENWKVTKLLNLLDMRITDGPHETPELFPEGVPFVSADAIRNGTIDFKHIRGFISNEFYDYCCLKYIPKINDIYMVKSGASTGKLGIVKTTDKFTIWSPLAVIRANEDICHYKYLYYVMYSQNFQKQVKLSWSFGTQENIGMRTLESLKIQYPNLEEQKEISNYLDSKCDAIDKIIETKQKKIEKLNQYKKSIIYEYVTGKKEV